MQTFLPYPSFDRSARTLDYRRLGKQRIEAKQILQILLNETEKKGWRNHPAVLMWKGYEKCLATYGLVMCREWKRRGYVDNQYDYFYKRCGARPDGLVTARVDPPWLGKRNFHTAHQSNLLRKNKKYYRKYFKTVSDNLPYIWPSKELNNETQSNVS